MWSPADARNDPEAGAPPYFRPLPRRPRYTTTGSEALTQRLSAFHNSPSSGSGSGSTFVIPFSWEHRPGIPKALGPFASPSVVPLLPLPPPLRSSASGPAAASHYSPRKKRLAVAAVDDPFAAALAECAKRPPGPSIEELFSRRNGGAAAVEPRRRSASAISDRLGLLGLHAASCKGGCAVSDSAVHVPRPGSRSGGSAYGSFNLRRSI